jgi:predicted DCC family thiol-disulfide oxidoreductase YuxK
VTRRDAKKEWSWRDDPSVTTFDDAHPLIVFDGECVLCSANAQLVLKCDTGRKFRLTTAQGPLGQSLYRHFGLSSPDYETMIVLENGKLLTESTAAIAIFSNLGWPWRIAATARIIPRPIRDGLYRLIARNRFRLFGRRKTCWVPSSETAGRIL